jgi:hypothetical protein
MKLAREAKLYRQNGQYLLALQCAKNSTVRSGKIEHVRALSWLAQYQAALQILDSIDPNIDTPKERLDYISAQNTLLVNLGQYDALDAQLASLHSILEQITDTIDSAVTHQQIAMVHGVLCHTKASIEHAEMATLLCQPLGPIRECGEAWYTLADAQHRAQEYKRSQASWTRCLSIQQSALRENHPEMALTLDGFALTLRQCSQPEMAIALHEKAKTIYESELPPNHPALGACLHGLGQALFRCGHFHRATRTFKLSLLCAEQNLPEDHPDICITRFELGRSEFDSGKCTEGALRMKVAHQKLGLLFGKEHPMVKRMKAWLDELLKTSNI